MSERSKPVDELDLAILACLQRDNQQTADDLAEQVGRSPSAVARRVRRLREEGVIAADIAVVADDVAGQPLFAVVQVQFERHALAELDDFRRKITASDNVQLYLAITGTFDIMLLVVAADMDGFNNFVDEMLAEHRAVRRYETSFVKRRLKATLALPLDQLVR